MLGCYHCTFLQHAACYRIVSADKAPAQHCCVSCSIAYGFSCTDTKLVKMSTNPAVTLTCLFRRVLAFLLEENRVALEVVMSRLGVEQDTADAVFQKLAEEGCLVKEGEEWVVQMEKLVETVLPRYMGKAVVRKQGIGASKTGEVEKVNNPAVGEEMEAYNYASEIGGAGDVIVSEEMKCSTVAKPNKVKREQEKRELVPLKGGEEGDSRRSKRRKVSAVKENLSI